MPDPNPYEAPQSKELSSTIEQQTDEQFPLWLGRALWLQLVSIVFVSFAAMIANVPDIIEICSAGLIGLLSIFNLLVAIRYRIGWLVILELIVISLPLTALFTLVFN